MMGQFRTLIRKTKRDQARRSDQKPVKPGTANKHVRVIYAATRVWPYEESFHATKGARLVRIHL